MTKRVLVTGGRAYADRERVFHELDLLHEHFGVAVVIHGAAQGADSLASLWANVHQVPEIAEPADWAQYGRAAGPIRNEAMLAKHAPDLVLAFPGGRGTEDMMRQAMRKNVTVIQVMT